MEAPNPGSFEGWRLLLYPGFAALGGFLGYVLRMMDAGLKVSPVRAVIESIAAGFVGALMMMMCQAMHLGAQWTGVIVGTCGWLGATASIRMLERVIRRKLGISDSEAPDHEPS